MDVILPQTCYQYTLPKAVWHDFLAQLTHDHQGQRITLKVLDDHLGNFAILRRQPLFSVTYESPPANQELVISVSRMLRTRNILYAHVIVQPQALVVATDADGNIQACTVTDSDQTQTVLYLEPRHPTRNDPEK